ncbi:hypothetical protein GIB67_026749 [Kingdonia uniflora]|uniref:Cytochrome P450 n=1 Tax=Kingdonia uniflora TaxID=39325 RepID=A0A7J7MHB3_9MAGN|nr:hypothetical protein GIB67_026749 [Kingdonia uniflora]
MVESDGKLKWGEMQSMKYTGRAVQELMRLKPLLSGNFRYVTRDISFGGYDIRKGWRILWVLFPAHMDPEIFDKPEKFQPSRFEGPSKSVPPYTYIPFGAGSRICPGSKFPRIDALLIIHHLVTNYGWTPLIPDEPLIHDPIPYPAKGLPVRLHPMLDRENTA